MSTILYEGDGRRKGRERRVKSTSWI